MSQDAAAPHVGSFESPNAAPRVPPPPDMRPEIVVHTQDDDERAWLQVAENAWVRPLMFNPMMGTWTDMMRAEGAQVLNRHHHANPVTVYTLEGAWGYLEHDWVATPGTFIVEPAGETHTLIVHPSAGHMKAIFHNWGAVPRRRRRGQRHGVLRCVLPPRNVPRALPPKRPRR